MLIPTRNRIGFLFLLVNVVANVKGETRGGNVDIFPSTRVNNVNATSVAVSLMDCADQCLGMVSEELGCTTATYNSGTKQCELSFGGVAETTSVVDTNVYTILLTRSTSNQFGKRFVTGFMNNCDNNGGWPYLVIVSSTAGPTTVWVNIPYLNVRDEFVMNDYLYLSYSNGIMPAMTTEVTQKGLQILSDKPIAVFTLNYESGSSDGTLLLPTEALGQEYIVHTHNAVTWGTGQILVTPVEDNTQVTLHFPSGIIETVTLNAFQTYNRRASTSEQLAGTIVTGNKRIAVEMGHQCANIPDPSTYFCDILVATVPPVEKLGRVFIVPYQRPRTNFSVGIAAPHDGTVVTISDVDGNVLQTNTLNRRSSMLLEYYNYLGVIVTASQKVLVTQYAHGSYGIYGDPSLTVIPAVTQFGSRYEFWVSSIYNNPGIVSIVMADMFDVGGILLNGAGTTITETFPCIVPGQGGFNVIYIEVSIAVKYTLSHVDPNARFAAILYARNIYEEYTTVLGYHFD